MSVVTFLRRVWLQNLRLNERDDDALYADDRVRWRAETDGNRPAHTMVASPSTWTFITRRSASPESITRFTSRSGTTTAAAGDRPQSVDPGPVSNHAVCSAGGHRARGGGPAPSARSRRDVASIDAEGLASTMALSRWRPHRANAGEQPIGGGHEGAFALEDFQLDRYR